MRCEFDYLGEPDARGRKRMRCVRCAFETAPTPHPPEMVFRECNKKGIGDYVAAGLRLLGFRRKCGGCEKRQAALNELGKKVGL